jgi:hypothetical protein
MVGREGDGERFPVQQVAGAGVAPVDIAPLIAVGIVLIEHVVPAPVMDEAAIEALIAKQREAIEAQLREKIRAEMMATMNQTNVEEKTEDATQV